MLLIHRNCFSIVREPQRHKSLYLSLLSPHRRLHGPGIARVTFFLLILLIFHNGDARLHLNGGTNILTLSLKSNIYEKHPLKLMGRLVLLFLSSAPQIGTEVPAKWLHRQVFLPHLWCRFLLRAHDNRAHKQTHVNSIPVSPHEPSGSQSQECEVIGTRPWSKQWAVFIISHCELLLPRMQMMSFPFW